MAIKYVEKKRKKSGIYKIIVVILSLALVSFILTVSPNYIVEKNNNKTSLVINNNNVTKELKHDVLIEDDVVYISKDDIESYFDGEIYYDSKYNQIVTTSETKIAVMPINSKQILINDSNVNIYAPVIQKDDQYYLPFSEISKSVYNVETTYIDSTKTVVLVSLDRELTYANSNKNNKVKYKPTYFSKTIDTVEKGNNLTVVSSSDGWTKVTTNSGKVGYVKSNSLANIEKIRDNFTLDKQIDGNVSLVWDYFSEHSTAPTRTDKIQGVNVVSPSFVTLTKQGQGSINVNIGTQGVNYINWAHNNGYKVWMMVSNSSMKETTSEILNDYKLRDKFINNIIEVVEQYNLDGVNLDFENIYEADKNNYSKLVIELAPRLKDLSKVLSVDVTAPDGSADWSLCFDRNIIGKVANYIVFMAYDQNGISSTEPGTSAGYDWVETNINKFINQEEVSSDKIILGIPFYTRIWKISDSVNSEVVNMKDTYSKIPAGTNIQWLSDLRQNYAEYIQDNVTYKVWIEDDRSISEKLSLVSQYNLAGASYWEKDRETDDVWEIVANKLNIK